MIPRRSLSTLTTLATVLGLIFRSNAFSPSASLRGSFLSGNVAAPGFARLVQIGTCVQSQVASRAGARLVSTSASRGRNSLLIRMNVEKDELNRQLRVAAEYGFAGQVEALAKQGADVNSVDVDQQHKAGIHFAAHQGHTEAVVKLIELGADPNKGTDSNSTALHFASAYGHLATVRALVSLGADALKKNDYDETPLDMAKFKGRYTDRVDFVTIVKVLQDAAAQKK